MARIKLQHPDTDIIEIQEIFAEIKEKVGTVPAAYRAFGRLPHILQANWNRTKNILSQGNLPIETKEAIATRVSAENGCHFCLSIHKSNLAKLGFTANEIQEIQDGKCSDNKLRFVLHFVTVATKTPEKLTDDDFQLLRTYDYSEEDILEILTVMEMYTGYNKIIVALGLSLED